MYAIMIKNLFGEFMSDKLLDTKLGEKYRKYCGRFMTFLDIQKDMKICHQSLAKTVVSDDREQTGATNSEPMRYWALDETMDGIEFSADDSFIDVGCAKGRVLAYMLYKKHPCKISGVELKKDVADIALDWTKEYDNVNVMCASAFDIDYNDYTHLFMFNPFTREMLASFIDLLEGQLKHSVKLIFFGNNIIYKLLMDRKGWTVERTGKTFKRGPICITYYPQRYAIYTYNPDERA